MIQAQEGHVLGMSACKPMDNGGLEAIPQQPLSLQNGLCSNQIILQRCRMISALLLCGEACHNTSFSLGVVNPFSRVNLQVDE